MKKDKYPCNYKFNDLYLKCYDLFKIQLLKNIIPKSKVLELGSGNGTLISYIESLNCNIYAVDNNEKSLIDLTKKHFISKINLINEDANEYVLKKNKFDAIITIATLHEINDINDKPNYLKKWLINLDSILEKSGKVIIGDYYYGPGVTLHDFNEYRKFQLKQINHADPIYKFIPFETILKVIKEDSNFVIEDFMEIRAAEEIDKRFYYFVLKKKK